jgi:hypothetical protein
LHFDNFGCSIPGLDNHAELDIIAHFSNPDCTLIFAINPMDQTASLPPYIVAAISMADYMVKSKTSLPIEAELPLLKILDFGSGVLLVYDISNMLTFFFSISAGRNPTTHAICNQSMLS